jgi:hypothetical protein
MTERIRRRWAALAIVTLLSLAAAPAAGSEEAKRSPFQAPPLQSAEAPRDFARAIRLVTLRGIVDTEDFSRVLVQLGPEADFAVFAPGDRISLDFSGVPHGFTVERIGVRSVVFKDAKGGTHEVVLP